MTFLYIFHGFIFVNNRNITPFTCFRYHDLAHLLTKVYTKASDQNESINNAITVANISGT